MEKIKIRFDQSKFNSLSRDMEDYTPQIVAYLDGFIDEGIISREDVTLPLVRGIFNRNATPLLDAISRNGQRNAESLNFALRDAMNTQIRVARSRVSDKLRQLWQKRESDLMRYRAVTEAAKSAFVAMGEDGNIFVNVEAIREYCTVYMDADKKTVELLNRAKKIFQDLKDLDRDLLLASTSLPVYAIGDLNSNALIKVEDAQNIWLDLPVFEDIDCTIKKRTSYANDRAKYWHVQDFEKC